MVRHRASKGLKLSFATFVLLSLTFYGRYKGENVQAGGRMLQEEEELNESQICAQLFPEECNLSQVLCTEEFAETCCGIVGSGDCITSDLDVCEVSDLCVADIVPGGGGRGRCFEDFERERAAGIIVYVIFLLYLFLAIAIICDDYFVPCLEKISDALSLTDDVAGATFMAAGSSAPELFVSLADNVISNPPQNLGTGAVVGGGVFNVLVIIGLSAVFAGQDLHLNWRPFARDYFFYIISVALLVGFVSDEEVEAYEGAILALFYSTYVIFMVYNARIFLWVDTKLGLLEITDEKEEKAVEGGEVKADEPLNDDEEDEEPPAKVRRMSKAEALKSYSSYRSLRSIQKTENNDGSYWEVFEWPETTKSRIYYLLSLPINILFRFTVPDCTHDVFGEDKEGQEENRRLGYSLGFTMCIVWIAILSHILVYCTSVFGCLVGLDASVMGLTLLAVGTNIPDALSSILVARNGKGDMAVANSIGSNVFDILIGLGVPWFIAPLAFGEATAVAVNDLTTAVIFLVASLAFLFTVLMIRKWRMDFKVGILLLIFYGFYVIFELFITPQIIGDDEE